MNERLWQTLALTRLTKASSSKTLLLLRESNPFDNFPAQDVSEAKAWAQAQLAEAQKQEIKIISIEDEDYPQSLLGISSPPPILYVQGNVSLLNPRLSVAIVGTRNPTTYGASAAFTLAQELAMRDISIVSGLAKGVDSQAHKGAVSVKGKTVAVLGNGLPSIYPSENKKLAQDILDQGGALVSERALGLSVEPRYLIARNRLQSGLSAAVVVIETALSGGTPHTAKFALEQGKPIFCPRPQKEREENAGIRALLYSPASRLPEELKAFSSAKKLCSSKGSDPIAKEITRENLDNFFLEIEALS
jgi:DNA processing protein